eukprot:gene5707-6592_t
MQFAPEVKAIYEKIRTEGSETTWALLGYDGAKKIVVSSSGSGDLEELKTHLCADAVNYGYVKIMSGDEESKRSKFLLLTFVGESVSPLKRAKVSVDLAQVKTVCQSFSLTIFAEKLDEINLQEIEARILKASGADYSGNKST